MDIYFHVKYSEFEAAFESTMGKSKKKPHYMPIVYVSPQYSGYASVDFLLCTSVTPAVSP